MFFHPPVRGMLRIAATTGAKVSPMAIAALGFLPYAKELRRSSHANDDRLRPPPARSPDREQAVAMPRFSHTFQAFVG
jgi:hypothetical protein